MEEAKIPVFSVLKKGKALKNIFLNYLPPETGKPSSPSADQDIVLIGRHPDCHIVVEHPSISRFHLEIISDSTSQKLFVTDRSSVHGTWVSGKKIQPDVPVELIEGDTLKLGASTRIYRLHWMLLSHAYEMEKPMSPLQEEGLDFLVDENAIQDENFDEVWVNHVIPSAPPMPEIWKDSFPAQFFGQGLKKEGQNLIMEEMEKQHSCFSSIAPLLESDSSSWPLESESGACENLLASEMQPEREELITLRSDQKAKSSSLLSRRNKSINFLEIERMREDNRGEAKIDKENLEIEEQMVGSFAGGNEEDKNSLVLLADVDVKEEEQESIVSDKENMTPVNSIGSNVLKSSRRIERSALSSCSLFSNDDLEIEGRENGAFIRSAEENILQGVLAECDAKEEKEETFYLDQVNITNVDSNGFKALKSNQEIETSPLSSARLFNKEALEIEAQKNGAVAEENVEEKIPLVFFAEGVVKEKEGDIFASGKENSTPVNSIGSKSLKNSRMIERSPLSSSSICKLDKEHSNLENHTSEAMKHLKSDNLKPIIHLMMGKEDSKFSNVNNLECLLSPGVNLQRSLFKPERSPLGENKVLNVEEERFLSDTDKTPEPLNSLKTKKALARDFLKAESEENEVLGSDKENLTPLSSKKSNKIPSKCYKKTEGETMKRRKERIPFQTLFEGSPLKNSSPVSYKDNHDDDKSCNKYSHNVQRPEDKTFDSQCKEKLPDMPEREKKKWYIVVDVGCLLTEEYRKSLQLLEGIRGTQLIIPRIVIRELDHLKRCQGILSRGTKASSVLQWIEECMVKTSWWIHVQSTSETFPAPPTPPATPRSQLCDGSTGYGGSNYASFSTCGSLLEIVSPTAEDHILDCALLFKRIKSEDGQLMLLTSSTTLRIKALAEGLLCETPKEFRDSLVNPFSKRFLWMDSSPRGSTWSCLDEVVLPENSHQQFATVRMPKAEGTVKGLKLILLHGSHFGTAKTI